MTSFFDAIAAGDYDEVETHLNAGADPNAPGSANLPPLHAAVAASEGELIRLLASRGADLERRDGWRRTALMLAAASNEVECAEMLVALGADPAEAQELAGDNEELLAVLLGETLERVGALSLGGAPAAPPVLASFVPTGSNKRRRGSVSSESYNPAAADAAVLGSTSRTPAEAARIERAIGSNFLFAAVDATGRRALFGAMEEVRFAAGETILSQGDREAHHFYVVDSGAVQCWRTFAIGQAPVMVKEVAAGGSFGELALMYNTPRAATVKAKTDCCLWALPRDAFRSIVLRAAITKRARFERFLERVPLLASMSAYERCAISDGLKEVRYRKDEPIIHQGDVGDTFYILMEGEAIASVAGALGRSSKDVQHYAEGSCAAAIPRICAPSQCSDGLYSPPPPRRYFGELALLYDQPRAATVVAATACVCAALERDAFERLLGPVQHILKRDAANYANYSALL